MRRIPARRREPARRPSTTREITIGLLPGGASNPFSGFAIGGLFTIMVIMAWFGILVLIGAWLLWRFQAKQVANVKAAYSQHLATVGAGRWGNGGVGDKPARRAPC
jgi:hypothetical protein